MRKHLVVASATLAFLTAACGTSSSTASASPTSASCTNPTAKHRAYLVIQHGSGATLQKCVGFDSDNIPGTELLKGSGTIYDAQIFSFGPGLCSVDYEPKTYSTCFPKDQPYWAIWVEVGGKWSSAATGYDKLMFHDREAMGLRYTPVTEASPAPPPLAKES